MELNELDNIRNIISIKDRFKKANNQESEIEKIIGYHDLTFSLKSSVIYNEEMLSILIQMLTDSLSICSDNYIKFTKHFRYVLRKVIEAVEDIRENGNSEKGKSVISESIDEFSDLLVKLRMCLTYKVYNLTLAVPRVVIVISLLITAFSCSLLYSSLNVL